MNTEGYAAFLISGSIHNFGLYLPHDTFGEDSPEYQSYVLGEIPEGAAETVIQSRWVEEAQRRNPDKEDRRPTVVTCDVAREGEDLTTFGVFKQGRFNLARFENDGRPGWLSHADLMQVAGRCMLPTT